MARMAAARFADQSNPTTPNVNRFQYDIQHIDIDFNLNSHNFCSNYNIIIIIPSFHR